ncbi:hypothetical protein ACLB2K_066626 [Fragaria x ananassa]
MKPRPVSSPMKCKSARRRLDLHLGEVKTRTRESKLFCGSIRSTMGSRSQQRRIDSDLRQLKVTVSALTAQTSFLPSYQTPISSLFRRKRLDWDRVEGVRRISISN